MQKPGRFNPNFFTDRPEEVGRIVGLLGKVHATRDDRYPDNPEMTSAREAMRARLLASAGASGEAIEDFDEEVRKQIREHGMEKYPEFSPSEYHNFLHEYQALSPLDRAELRRKVFVAKGYLFGENGKVLEYPNSFPPELVESLALDFSTGESLIVSGWCSHNEAFNRLKKEIGERQRARKRTGNFSEPRFDNDVFLEKLKERYPDLAERVRVFTQTKRPQGKPLPDWLENSPVFWRELGAFQRGLQPVGLSGEYVIGGLVILRVPGWRIPFLELNLPDDCSDDERKKIGEIFSKSRRLIPVEFGDYRLIE